MNDDTPTIGKMLLAGAVAIGMLVLLFFAVRASAQEPPVVAVIASVCLGSDCKEVVVTSSEQDPSITMDSCKIGQPQLAAWLIKNWPGYELARWKCVSGARRRET